ncbi:MAG: hypothetical protein HOL51_27640 [Gemmatimonadetes bacterium]|nr:hypothetical protein [Gemmatimonadota bacterium]
MKRPQLPTAFYMASGLVLLTGLLVNPWVGRLYRDQLVNYQDVMLGYFCWSMGLAGLLALCGFSLARQRTERRINLCILAATVALLVLADRMVLAWVGLPYWIVDQQVHYRHRPGVTRNWLAGNPSTAADLGIGDRLIHINDFGHHDDDFPAQKPAGEFRGLLIGDSIVMGHGVTKDEAFSNGLEDLLRNFARGPSSYQIINTGVQGYATSQELHILEESLAFAPDFIAIGFAVNDVTRPFQGQSRETTAPHALIRGLAGVQNASTLLRYALNETGFGRLVQVRRQDVFREGGEDSWTLEVSQLSRAERDDPGFREGWDIVLADLERMYALAHERDIPVVLLVFPETHQLFAEDMQRPQAILAAHAQAQGVDCIDLTDHVEQWLRWDLEAMVARAQRPAPAARLYGQLYQLLANFYFMDPLHLTVEGHGRVALVLADYLVERGLVEADREALARRGEEAREWGISNAGRVLHVVVPLHYEQLMDKGAALHALGRYEAAARVYKKGLAQFREAWVRVGLYRSIGDVRADQSRAVESQAAYGRAIELANQIAATAPADDEAIRRFLGLLYLSAGREGEAVAVLGRDRVGLYLQMGLDLLAEGRLEPAANAFRAALVVDANNLAARVNLGWALFTRGDLEGAIAEYRQVLESGPEINAIFNLGLVLLARGDIEAAKGEYAQGIERYGSEQAREVGAVDDLLDLARRGVQVGAVQEILRAHWQGVSP